MDNDNDNKSYKLKSNVISVISIVIAIISIVLVVGVIIYCIVIYNNTTNEDHLVLMGDDLHTKMYDISNCNTKVEIDDILMVTDFMSVQVFERTESQVHAPPSENAGPLTYSNIHIIWRLEFNEPSVDVLENIKLLIKIRSLGKNALSTYRKSNISIYTEWIHIDDILVKTVPETTIATIGTCDNDYEDEFIVAIRLTRKNITNITLSQYITMISKSSYSKIKP